MFPDCGHSSVAKKRDENTTEKNKARPRRGEREEAGDGEAEGEHAAAGFALGNTTAELARPSRLVEIAL
jgi:hypothetical protein